MNSASQPVVRKSRPC